MLFQTPKGQIYQQLVQLNSRTKINKKIHVTQHLTDKQQTVPTGIWPVYELWDLIFMSSGKVLITVFVKCLTALDK